MTTYVVQADRPGELANRIRELFSASDGITVTHVQEQVGVLQVEVASVRAAEALLKSAVGQEVRLYIPRRAMGKRRY